MKFDAWKAACPLTKWMRTHNIKQHQLAAVIGASRQTIHNWCSGACSPEGRHAEALARVMKISVDQFDADWLEWRSSVPPIEGDE